MLVAAIRCRLLAIARRAGALAIVAGLAAGFATPPALAQAQSAHALPATIRLATGDYPPFVGEKEPGYGVTTAIVVAALNAEKLPHELVFLPWKRGFVETQRAVFEGTFPYLRTAEREAGFLYSDPIIDDQLDIYALAGADKPTSWSGARLCIPLGYDQSLIAEFIARHQATVETPNTIENCFQMLRAKRVAGIWVSPLVAASTQKALFGRDWIAAPMGLGLVGKQAYHLIISRAHPNGLRLLERFNRGLRTIRADGSYQRIVASYLGN